MRNQLNKKKSLKNTSKTKSKSKSLEKKGNTTNLDSLRKKIDRLDDQIIQLLNDRTMLVLDIGKNKIKTSKSIYAPERESQIFQKLEVASEKGVLPVNSLTAIYREVMSASLALEKPLTISYLGPPASFTHLASLSKFGSSVSYSPAESINEVFHEVSRERADYGVIPIENSIEGAVNHSLDMFIDSDLKICSEILYKIEHNLMSHSSQDKIERIYSHPQVFGQCRKWLEIHMPRVELVETVSTTVAAGKAKKEKKAAALASKLAASMYDLPIIAEGVQDFAKNVTRFLVIAQQLTKPTKNSKTSILVSTTDKVGALYEMLLPFKMNKINMTKIESRPSKKKNWEYFFYIDFEGHLEQPKIKKLIQSIEKTAKFVKVLGSFPASPKKEF